ncbi:hypothetical protein ACWDNR_18210, partial [Gordonia aichiensis]
SSDTAHHPAILLTPTSCGRKNLFHAPSIRKSHIETDINRGVKTSLMADTRSGVAAMVKAIEAEKSYAPVPPWPWVPIAAALRYLPGFLTRRMI